MDPFYIIAACIVLVGSALIVPMFTCGRSASAELNLEPLWQERCSGKMGAFGIGIPAIRIAIYQDFMVIAFLGQTVIPYRDIAEISLEKGISRTFATGVTLKLKGLRSYYVFNSHDPKGLVELLKSRLSDQLTGSPPSGAC